MTVWFAVTFFAYLETQSVFATAIVSGIYLVVTALSGFWLGSLVDHHKKKQIMLASSLVSLVFYMIATVVFALAPEGTFKHIESFWLWALIISLLLGVMAGNLRTIALPTLVTILIPADRRDKANGLVGASTGISFLVVSVISGFMIGFWGLWSVLALSITLTIAAFIHLLSVKIPEKGVAHLIGDGELPSKKVDIKGTFRVVVAIPGLMALIIFSTFNNFLGGVFMPLMDAYGLSMVSVQVWGLLWGAISVAFIAGGILVAKKGLGKNPLRTLLLANIAIWAISSVFTIQPSIILLSAGMFVYLLLAPVIEASEQTLLQRVVPLERQGRVFGFAQSIEQSASPLTAFLIGPIAQFIFIPFMTVGAGVELIGGWFGSGPARGIALVFCVTGLIGLVISLLAMTSKYYRQLSSAYEKAGETK
ncbi:MAG TPA: MFS transporter [Candidatus Saccharimonadales bacterium]|nr:MFS transporter [Candidatus Saccharimonadales bacterium]